ncbi:MAG: hypothetical protein WCT02_02045 [Candidatus Paceibacterota bacterium]|jgi:hypothetical protein
MNQNDMNEWKKDIGEAEHSYPHFANGPFIRALFKSAQEISSVSQHVMRLSGSVDKSNEHLTVLNTNLKQAATSSDKHSNAMKYLTFGLVFLGLAQVAVAYLSYHAQNSEIDMRKNCFKSVLNTSNIDLNYKNCLRNNGLKE